MPSNALVRSAVAAVLASSAVIAVPWTAAAAENQPPAQPLLSELTTDGRACAAGADRIYVGTRPTMKAVLRDPDAVPPRAEQLRAEFEVSWTDSSGEPQVRTIAQGAKASGSPFTAVVPDDVPAFTEVSWRVRAFDGALWGPWSSEGAQHPCEFVYDNEFPAKPTVVSAEYPDDDAWHDGVGIYGTFTMDSTSDDAVAYMYRFTGGSWRTVRPSRPGDAVTLSWLPESDMSGTLTVEAVDRASNTSMPTNYSFLVSSGRPAVAAWGLADAAGATEAVADAGSRSATAGGGVTFGVPGPDRTTVASAAELDGSDAAHLTSGASAVATDKAFSVSAWVRPDAVDEDLAAVSQDGPSAAAFRLGTATGADGQRVWSFGLGAPGSVVSAEGGRPEAGEWAHLVGVYDPVAGTARLYVNGRSVATTDGAVGIASSGDLQLGRALGADGEGENWHGALAQVRVWDRIVVPAEAANAALRTTRSKGYWALDEAADGVSPERDGGPAMALGGDASLYHANNSCDPGTDPECLPVEEPIVGTGHLVLDGEGDYAATQGPVVDTSDSFSLAAHVKLDASTQDKSMTVLSLPGEHNTLVSVGYSAEAHRWQATVAQTDEAGAPTTTLTAEGAPVSFGYAQHLAVVYDDAADEVLFYVDGQLSAHAPLRTTWQATGGLQVGRSATADGWGGYLAGAVDEVHAFEGALTETQVAFLRMGETDV
ncbi:LamG domain-containing protein [Streptomyces sp. NPDC050095]|uniref:LamG domain-containing protein n=1 Tax=unclassified Streptomyces TaxID=2593676 RepID=UPI00344161F0